MRVAVDPEDLEGAGAVVGEAARMLGAVAVQRDLETIEAVFPGGLTAATVREMGRRWSDQLLAVKVGVASLGGVSRAAGKRYVVLEHIVRRALAGMGERD